MRAPRGPFRAPKPQEWLVWLRLEVWQRHHHTYWEKFSIHAWRRSANTSGDGNQVTLHRPEPLLALLLLLLRGLSDTTTPQLLDFQAEGLFSKGSISRKQVRKSWFPCQAPCHCRWWHSHPLKELCPKPQQYILTKFRGGKKPANHLTSVARLRTLAIVALPYLTSSQMTNSTAICTRGQASILSILYRA